MASKGIYKAIMKWRKMKWNEGKKPLWIWFWNGNGMYEKCTNENFDIENLTLSQKWVFKVHMHQKWNSCIWDMCYVVKVSLYVITHREWDVTCNGFYMWRLVKCNCIWRQNGLICNDMKRCSCTFWWRMKWNFSQKQEKQVKKENKKKTNIPLNMSTSKFANLNLEFEKKSKV